VRLHSPAASFQRCPVLNSQATRERREQNIRLPLELRTSPFRIDFRLFLRRKAKRKPGPSERSQASRTISEIISPGNWRLKTPLLWYGVGRICDRTSVGTGLETVTHSFSAFTNHSRFFFYYHSWIRQRHFQDASYYNGDGAEYEEEGWGRNGGQSAAARYHRRSVQCQEFLFELG
jgi:hypothetical protein